MSIEAPVHGGDLHAAAARYGLPAPAWLDLSAGINPVPYPVPALPADCFQRLPPQPDALLAAAQDYYGAPRLVAAAGSQALIQALPLLRPPGRVAVPASGYAEHAFRWRLAGHDIVPYEPRETETLAALVDSVDVVVVINPHNPLALRWPAAQLLDWRQRLAQRGGWLVVDEAFIDVRPEHSVIAHSGEPGLVVLRSLGKFFGLAGLRCGFAACEPALAEQLTVALGPWSVSGPAQAVATAALVDHRWQRAARPRLLAAAQACGDMLASSFRRAGAVVLRGDLFNTVALTPAVAERAQDALARHGIWTRRLALDEGNALLRFGLVDPGRRDDWQRFQIGLSALAPCFDAGQESRPLI